MYKKFLESWVKIDLKTSNRITWVQKILIYLWETNWGKKQFLSSIAFDARETFSDVNNLLFTVLVVVAVKLASNNDHRGYDADQNSRHGSPINVNNLDVTCWNTIKWFIWWHLYTKPFELLCFQLIKLNLFVNSSIRIKFK